MSDVKQTDPDTLPQWNGRPVPWVTRFTNEISPERYAIGADHNGVYAYSDGRNNRDKHEVLWQREGITRGGKPDWAAVSTYRQRASMTRRLCQVCGNKIPPGPIHWLMPIQDAPTIPLPDGSELTWNPPTCEGCIPLALSLCPHLKAGGYQILKVLDYEVWGVSGITTISGKVGLPDQAQAIQTVVPYDKTVAMELYGPDGATVNTRVLAQQTVVKLGAYVIEERVEGTRPAASPDNVEQMMRNLVRNAYPDISEEDLTELLEAAQATAQAMGQE